jgi:hypothetical protein
MGRMGEGIDGDGGGGDEVIDVLMSIDDLKVRQDTMMV